MSQKQVITVFFHPPTFTKEEVGAYLKLKTWPRTFKHEVTWPMIKTKVAAGDFNRMQIKSLSYLMWILSPEFHYTKWGLYLTDFDRRFNPEKYVNQFGKFKSEGLINHLYLKNVVKNRVAQFELGARAIRSWVHAIRNFKKLRHAVIYLTGTKDLTLALYSHPKRKEITTLNKGIDPDRQLKQMAADKFIKWSL